MTNASASRVLDEPNSDRPVPLAKLAAGHLPAIMPPSADRSRPESDDERGERPAATRRATATESAWDGPVDMWVDDDGDDAESDVPWSTRGPE